MKRWVLATSSVWLLFALVLFGCSGQSTNQNNSYSLMIETATDGKISSFEVSCSGQQKCRDLIEKARAVEWEPVPENAVCTKIYGGSEETRVRGEIGNKVIDATFTRTDGCEIERFQTLEDFLVAARSKN